MCRYLANLIVKWILSLEVADKFWFINIDATMSGTKGSFPKRDHVTFANKIAQAVLSANCLWEAGSLDISQVTLTE
jgi:hypothetical protein